MCKLTAKVAGAKFLIFATLDLGAIISQHFKPIFHCDAKPFSLGTGVGLDPQRHTFASSNTKDTIMLVSFALGDANFSRHPTQNPNASQWNIGGMIHKLVEIIHLEEAMSQIIYLDFDLKST